MRIIICSALLLLLAACSDHEEPQPAPSPRPVDPPAEVCPTVRITHGSTSFPIPGFTGSSFSATIDWGDGEREPYAPEAVHSYEKEGTYTVTIRTQGAERMTLDDLKAVSVIDLSEFTPDIPR